MTTYFQKYALSSAQFYTANAGPGGINSVFQENIFEIQLCIISIENAKVRKPYGGFYLEAFDFNPNSIYSKYFKVVLNFRSATMTSPEL